MSTKGKLAQVLHARGLFDLEQEARAGRFDDFESESATPQIDLVQALRSAGVDDLAQRAMNGEWDCTPEEAEAWFQREGKDLLLEDLQKR